MYIFHPYCVFISKNLIFLFSLFADFIDDGKDQHGYLGSCFNVFILNIFLHTHQKALTNEQSPNLLLYMREMMKFGYFNNDEDDDTLN